MSMPDLARAADGSDESPARTRILDAAFGAFSESGYARTSTLEIATRARVSKRELYALGFPVHFIVLLGVWKVLGSIAILVPGFPLIKEWAYAGITVDLTGAAAASIATGGEWWHVAAPLSIAVLVAASWALRPGGAVTITARCSGDFRTWRDSRW